MEHSKVKVVDEFQVAPPQGTLPNTLSLPLTMYDLPMLIMKRKLTFKRLFFYEYSHSLHHFTQITIPLLKSSLSITLQYFYPFVSDLILPPHPQKPYFLFTEGNSVSFIVAQYSGDDFDDITSNQIKQVSVLQSLAPSLPPTRVTTDGTQMDSLLVVQVTLFPNQGICIGIGFDHAVTDGRSVSHFFNAWSSICRSNGVVEIDKFPMPSFDRDSIDDPSQLESTLLKMWQDSDSNSISTYDYPHYAHKVRSTFVMKRAHVEKLKQYISSNMSANDKVYLSSLVVTCSFIWVCFMKSLAISDDGNDKDCRIIIPVDMRNSISRIPTTYFGNCLAAVVANIKRSELEAQNGLLVAARAIGNCIKELQATDGALRVMEAMVTRMKNRNSPPSHILVVAGSPKFEGYNKDFGWGLPKKAESLPHDLPCMSLDGRMDEEGGIEVGLELERPQMDSFTQHFHQSLIITSSKL